MALPDPPKGHYWRVLKVGYDLQVTLWREDDLPPREPVAQGIRISPGMNKNESRLVFEVENSAASVIEAYSRKVFADDVIARNWPGAVGL